MATARAPRSPVTTSTSRGTPGSSGLARGADGAVALPAVPIADMATGLQAALAVVSGLRLADDALEPGFRADVTMMDSALSLTAIGQAAVLATGHAPPTPDVLTGGLACYAVYRCADGLELACAGLEPQFFARLATLVGDTSLAAAQYDITGQDALHGRLVTLFSSRPRHEWLDLLEDDQTCVSPVRSTADALGDPDLASRGVVVDVALADGRAGQAFRPVAWLPGDDTPLGAPALGSDTDDVLRGLGVDPGRLRSEGVVG